MTLVIVAVLLGTTVFCSPRRPPSLRRKRIRAPISLNTPKYATADYTQLFSKQFTNAGEKIPEIDDSFLIVGIDGGGGGFSASS